MGYKYKLNENENLIIIQTEELVDLDVLTDIIKDIFSNAALKKDSNLLLDFRDTVNMKIDHDEIKLLAEYARSFKKSFDKIKVAFILNDYKQKTVHSIWMGMVSSFINLSNIKVSDNEEELYSWLNS